MEAKLHKMFEHVSHLPTQEKAYKIVEQRQTCQEKLQEYRSELWLVRKKLSSYTRQKTSSELLLSQFAAGEVVAGPRIDEAKASVQKAGASIPKYESLQQSIKLRIERLERSLEHQEKLLQQIRLSTLRRAYQPQTHPTRQSGTLVMASGSQIDVQIVKVPKHKTPEVCSCCLEEVDFACGDACTLDCLHGYHFTCVSEWLKKAGKCPCCSQSTCTLFKFSSDSDVQDEELSSVDDLLDGASTKCIIPSDTEN